MDTSKQYMKMCDDERIQGLWEPKVGDNTDNGVVICVSPDGWIHTQAELSLSRHRRKDLIFKPRQDQLQGMTGFNLGRLDALSILVGRFWVFLGPVEFAEENWRIHEEYLENFDSMEQLWLAFVMNELHNLRWDGAWKEG